VPPRLAGYPMGERVLGQCGDFAVGQRAGATGGPPHRGRPVVTAGDRAIRWAAAVAVTVVIAPFPIDYTG
jgi:hypothetical protein